MYLVLGVKTSNIVYILVFNDYYLVITCYKYSYFNLVFVVVLVLILTNSFFHNLNFLIYRRPL